MPRRTHPKPQFKRRRPKAKNRIGHRPAATLERLTKDVREAEQIRHGDKAIDRNSPNR